MKKTLFVIKTLLLAFLLLSLASIPGGFVMGYSSTSRNTLPFIILNDTRRN